MHTAAPPAAVAASHGRVCGQRCTTAANVQNTAMNSPMCGTYA